MNFQKWFPVIAMSPIAMTLLFAGAALTFILPVFSYRGYLPLGSTDLVFLFFLTVLAATYRPGWIFLLLVSVLPLETVDLAPSSIGSGIRPYQFLTLAIVIGLIVRFLTRRPLPELPRFGAGDFLLSLVPIGSLVAVINASEPLTALRFSVILFSFYGLYFLFRIFVRTSEDIGRILPFVIVSAIATVFFAIVQNILFLGGNGTYEVMPGRPNASFAEPDWLGMFLVLSLTTLLSVGYMIAARTESMFGFLRMKRSILLFVASTAVIAALIIAVSRSAWLGAVIASVVVIGASFIAGRRQTATVLILFFGVSAILSSILVFAVPLTDFDLFGRAGSVGSGLQTITVSCGSETVLPDRIRSVDELASRGCRHINLDEIDFERSADRFVTTIKRDDPNVSIRKKIYEQSISLGSEHPVLGVGWGTVSGVLGADERGAGLNASDVFLEIWLGSGLVGIFGFISFLILLAIRAVRDFFFSCGVFPLFLIATFAGLTVFNLFNSGILLGFFWALLGISGSYIFHEADFSETL
ncbi:MAG: hypothetical protein HGA31_01810 [Candidatus Moranbacteria bacterium]|nr:hypothetical protein [Candidatus Moranbacteria bacterium]